MKYKTIKNNLCKKIKAGYKEGIGSCGEIFWRNRCFSYEDMLYFFQQIKLNSSQQVSETLKF